MIRLGKTAQKTLRLARRALHLRIYLFFVEKAILSKKFESDQPQLFILGLPRSGTTLIYQYIVHRLKVAYFANGVGRYYLSPCVITFLQHRLHWQYRSDFKSNYGKVTGRAAPREAGSFWARFFGFEEYIRYEDLSAEQLGTLRNTIACVQRIFGNIPFVNKNVKHMLRIDALSTIFQNSYFLVVERNLHDVALSLLRARYENLEDPTMWWSLKPPNYAELKDLHIPKQVAQQLISLQEKMESDLLQLPEERVLRVKYEQFCGEPESLIQGLVNVLGPVGLRNPPETSFKPSVYEAQTVQEEQLVRLIEHATSR